MVQPRTFWDLLRESGGVYESTIKGVSMVPTLPDGARVRIKPLASQEYRIGQVVACALGDELFAHRIIYCAGGAVVTRGDNRVLCDPPTEKTKIIGEVVEQWVDGSWRPLGAAPAPRLPRVTAANDRLVCACLDRHFELGLRVAGTILHVGRFYRLAAAAARSLAAPKA